MKRICIGFLNFIPTETGRPNYSFTETPLTFQDLQSGIRQFPIWRDVGLTPDEFNVTPTPQAGSPMPTPVATPPAVPRMPNPSEPRVIKE